MISVYFCVNPIQDGNLLSNWCNVSRLYLVLFPNYLTLVKSTPKKFVFFWSNPYKIEVMITSLTDMLEIPNFGHLTTSAL